MYYDEMLARPYTVSIKQGNKITRVSIAHDEEIDFKDVTKAAAIHYLYEHQATELVTESVMFGAQYGLIPKNEYKVIIKYYDGNIIEFTGYTPSPNRLPRKHMIIDNDIYKLAGVLWDYVVYDHYSTGDKRDKRGIENLFDDINSYIKHS